MDEIINGLAQLLGEMKLAPARATRTRMLNQNSIWFSQLAWVGVK